MKVVFATGIYPPDIGGPATYVRGVAEAFAAEGVGCEVVTYGSSVSVSSSQRSSPFSVHRVSRDAALPIRYGRFFYATRRATSSDAVVYLQDPISAGFPGTLAARSRGRPTVLKLVGDLAWEIGRERKLVSEEIDEFQAARHGGLVGRLRSIERYVARRAARVVTPSGYLKGIVHGWGVPEDRIEVIHNAVRESQEQEQEHEPARLEGEPSILSVGRLVPWKGFETLLAAFARIAPKHEGARLHIVGSGPDESALRRRVAELGLESRVHLRGGVDRAVLRRHLASSDVFVLASTYEGFSHVLLEAMQAGATVVASRAGGNPELVVDGESGLLVDPDVESLASGLGRAIEDRTLRDELARGARLRAESFRWEVMVSRSRALLQSVADGAKRAR